jgi:hypothetical protein
MPLATPQLPENAIPVDWFSLTVYEWNGIGPVSDLTLD